MLDPDGVRAVPLFEGRAVTIGRNPPADIAVRHASLSRQHACVELTEGAIWVEDLDSTNGTWVNNERIQRARLESGAEIAFGAVSATLHVAGERSASDLESHERFRLHTEAEVNRAKSLRRPVPAA